jgi:hypothetical protein
MTIPTVSAEPATDKGELRSKAGFVGFGPRHQFIIVLAGVLLGALAFWGSWSLAAKAQSRLGMEEQDGKLIESMTGVCTQGEDCISESQIRMALQFRALETYAHVKGISNNQSLGVLAIGAGMALMSIGFSLFLVGAEGAFRVKASTGSTRNDGVMLYGTAPGLLAFALATVMVWVGAKNGYQLQFDAKVPTTAGSQTRMKEIDAGLNDLCGKFRADPSAYGENERTEYEKVCGTSEAETIPEAGEDQSASMNPECPRFLQDPSRYTNDEQQMYTEICGHPKGEIEVQQ